MAEDELIDIEKLKLQRLLQLFPHKALKEMRPWDNRRRKDLLIEEIATLETSGTIMEFVVDQCRMCKQRVYLFTNAAPFDDLPLSFISDVSPISSVVQEREDHPPERQTKPIIITGSRQRTDIYIVEASSTVHLRNPPEEREEPHLWPIMVQVTDEYCLVRFVKLERNLKPEFGDRHVRSYPLSLTEEEVCSNVLGHVTKGLSKPVDFSPAVKKLIQDNVLDADLVKLKDGDMTSTHELDQGKTIKRDLSPEQFEAMILEPNLLKIKAWVAGWDISVGYFFCEPTFGVINFSTYSERGETDYVLQKILRIAS